MANAIPFVLEKLRGYGRILNSAEVASLLGLPVRTVTDLATRWQDSKGLEGIPAFKNEHHLGRRWHFDPRELEQWLVATGMLVISLPDPRVLNSCRIHPTICVTPAWKPGLRIGC